MMNSNSLFNVLETTTPTPFRDNVSNSNFNNYSVVFPNVDDNENKTLKNNIISFLFFVINNTFVTPNYNDQSCEKYISFLFFDNFPSCLTPVFLGVSLVVVLLFVFFVADCVGLCACCLTFVCFRKKHDFVKVSTEDVEMQTTGRNINDDEGAQEQEKEEKQVII